MELHLIMGVFNHLIKFLGGKWQDVSIWLKEMKTVSQTYHGGQFEGPEC